MAKKYGVNPKSDDTIDLHKNVDKLVANQKKTQEMNDFFSELDKIKELDEQNPLEQAIKYRAVKNNPPEPGYMEVRLFEDKDKNGNPIVVSESDIPDDDGEPSGKTKRFKHSPFFVVDLNKLLTGDITSCPSSVGPMLIDMSQKLVELKKGAFKVEKRKHEFNWLWIVFVIFLIIGILSAVFMILGGGGG